VKQDESGLGVERLLTYRETARLLGVTERTVWSMVDRGELAAVRFGRSVRVDPRDLRAFIDGAKGACSTGIGAGAGVAGAA
jgi:excisionase family DNA binding protein